MADATIPSESEIGLHLVNAAIAQSESLTDMSDGSVLSVLLKGAVAPEIVGLYMAGLTTANGFYVSTASGSALRRRLADFGIFPDVASSAYGSVRFARVAGTEGDIAIASGSVVRTTRYDGENLDFATRAVATLPDGDEYVDVFVDASLPGTDHNVGAMTLTVVAPIANIASAAFINAITTGKDASRDADLRSKFSDWLDVRSRGTVAAIRYGALTYSVVDDVGSILTPVSTAGVEEHLLAAGPDDAAVSVFIFGQNGQASTDDDVVGVQAIIDGYTTDDGDEIEGWRPAGIKVNVAKAVIVSVDVNVSITLSASGTQQDVLQLEARLASLVASIPIGKSLKVKSIFDEIAAMGTAVENANIIAPVEDVSASPSQKLILGQLTVLGG